MNMQRAKGIGHRAPRALFTPRSALCASRARGFTYVALLAAIVIIGISLGSATKYWQSISLRDKEEELIFRGDQYYRAIERYYFSIPGRMQYPQSMDELLKDSRTPQGKRYLRQKYKDPVTGEDFVEIRDPLSNRITGVYSASEKEPIKQANFPEQYKDFEGKKRYSDWRFVYAPPQGLPQSVHSVIPGQRLPVSPPGPHTVPTQTR
jgi:type II secretory pathway pseudopilin PulG